MHDAGLVFIGFVFGAIGGVVQGISVMIKFNKKRQSKKKVIQRFHRCHECGLDLTRGGEVYHEGVITIKCCDHCGDISNWLLVDGEYLPVIRPLKPRNY